MARQPALQFAGVSLRLKRSVNSVQEGFSPTEIRAWRYRPSSSRKPASDRNLFSSSFRESTFPASLARMSMPTVPVFFNPYVSAIRLASVSSSSIKAALVSIARVIASASPSSRSRFKRRSKRSFENVSIRIHPSEPAVSTSAAPARPCPSSTTSRHTAGGTITVPKKSRSRSSLCIALSEINGEELLITEGIFKV